MLGGGEEDSGGEASVKCLLAVSTRRVFAGLPRFPPIVASCSALRVAAVQSHIYKAVEFGQHPQHLRPARLRRDVDGRWRLAVPVRRLEVRPELSASTLIACTTLPASTSAPAIT